MGENQEYLKKNGLPSRLVFLDGNIGEWLDGGFRILFSASECYGEYAEAVGKELARKYNGGLILQMHWQFSDRTEMKSQSGPKSDAAISEWARDVQGRHPLPEGARWLMVNEESEHFVWAAAG